MHTQNAPSHARQTIAVVGLGYVGLSLAVLLARQHKVWAIDNAAEKVDALRNSRSPIDDADIQQALTEQTLDLHPSQSTHRAFREADYVIVATPTDYDPHTQYFNTQSVEAVLAAVLAANPHAVIVIKSTVPVGFTQSYIARYRAPQELPLLVGDAYNSPVWPSAANAQPKLLFSPEFLREGRALHDNRYPSRIVVGGDPALSAPFAALLKNACETPEVPITLTPTTEAEAIKLFANTYLAMRIAFFNELDSFAETHHLATRPIIEGVCQDPRIGDHYNNPSFGYGGYCLPKDTQQLLANYRDVPSNLMRAIVDANTTRKDFIADQIAKLQPKTVGIYRLAMKQGSDNFRSSAIIDVMTRLQARGICVIVYEPSVTASQFAGASCVRELCEFKVQADVILANRMTLALSDVQDKVYSRDVFGRD